MRTEIAERVLNHARERIEATYDVHDYIDEKREALEKWAAYLRDLAVSSDRYCLAHPDLCDEY